jgi:hypothetical protein
MFMSLAFSLMRLLGGLSGGNLLVNEAGIDKGWHCWDEKKLLAFCVSVCKANSISMGLSKLVSCYVSILYS